MSVAKRCLRSSTKASSLALQMDRCGLCSNTTCEIDHRETNHHMLLWRLKSYCWLTNHQTDKAASARKTQYAAR